MKKREFKVGDSVRYVKADDFDIDATIGKVYTVNSIDFKGGASHFPILILDDNVEIQGFKESSFEHVEEFVNGQEVEVRDCLGEKWRVRVFIGIHPGGGDYKHVVATNTTVSYFKYCRAIQETPEYTMEQAIELVGHEFKIKQ